MRSIIEETRDQAAQDLWDRAVFFSRLRHQARYRGAYHLAMRCGDLKSQFISSARLVAPSRFVVGVDELRPELLSIRLVRVGGLHLPMGRGLDGLASPAQHAIA